MTKVVATKKTPSFEELKKLTEKKRCLNCDRPMRVMIPIYQNPMPELYFDIKLRFTPEQQKLLMFEGGICLDCMAGRRTE